MFVCDNLHKTSVRFLKPKLYLYVMLMFIQTGIVNISHSPVKKN